MTRSLWKTCIVYVFLGVTKSDLCVIYGFISVKIMQGSRYGAMWFFWRPSPINLKITPILGETVTNSALLCLVAGCVVLWVCVLLCMHINIFNFTKQVLYLCKATKATAQTKQFTVVLQFLLPWIHNFGYFRDLGHNITTALAKYFY